MKTRLGPHPVLGAIRDLLLQKMKTMVEKKKGVKNRSPAIEKRIRRKGRRN